MLSSLLLSGSLLACIGPSIAFTPPYLDPAALSDLASTQSQRHHAALDAYRYNLASRPDTVERAKKVRVLAAGLERQVVDGGSKRLRDLSDVRQFERRQEEEDREGGRRKVVELGKRQSGSGQKGVVPLLDFYSQPLDVMVYGQVDIGTPSQSFDLLFDTGSSDLWVYASGTGSSQPEWDASRSSTAETDPVIPWSIRYGKGSQTGYLNQDIVSIGGYTVNNTVFAAADSLNQAFQYYPISGLFGLGFGTISASGYAPWFERLIESGQLAQQYFSMYFVRASDVTQQAEGSLSGAQLCIGCVDSSKYRGDISWNPVRSEGFWSITMDGISVNGSLLSGTGGRAALDSGTTLIQVPTTAAEAFYSQIPGARQSALGDGSYVVPCSTSFSSLAFSFNGIQYEIPPEDLLRAVSRDGSQCVLTIMAQDLHDVDGVPMAIVGEVFLKNAYSIYSYSHNGAPAVGLAKSIIAGTWSSNGTDSSQSRPGGSRFSQPVNQGSLSYSGAPLPTVSSVSAASRTTTETTTGRAIVTTAGLGGTGALTGTWSASTARGSSGSGSGSGSGAAAGGSTSSAGKSGSAVSLGAVVLSSGLALLATVLAAGTIIW